MKILLSLLCVLTLTNASDILYMDTLTLEDAIEIVQTQNLEIQAASLDEQSAHIYVKQASGHNWGTLDFEQNIARSNDAGNVFGFKLTSREASFNDFGFDEFLGQMGGLPGNAPELLATQPDKLNYPDDRNFFQSKLVYQLPLYTGGQISSYTDIAASMEKIKSLEKAQVISEKVYETRKSFYDMALLKNGIENLQTILNNISTLENTTKSMIDEGYAKTSDLLEVQARKSNVLRNINQMESNKQLLYHYLSFLLNRDVSAIETPASEITMPSYSDDEILMRNIDLKRATTGLAIRSDMVDVSQANYFPMIGVKAEVQTAADSFNGYSIDKGSYTLGAQLTWNLFNGGIDVNKAEKAQVEHLKTKTEVELAKKGIRLKIHQIRTQISTLDYEIISLNKELELANEIYQNYEGRYKEQLASMSDVIIKQSQQIGKILQLLQIKNKRNERIFALEKLANGVEK